jgi:hypothetical protein
MSKLKYSTSLSLILLLFSTTGFANQNLAENRMDFRTTWLKSTAGIGVASVLMDEATILNPAPIGFYDNSSFYFQKGNLEQQNTSTVTSANNSRIDELGFIVSDSKGLVGGSFSYHKQEYSAAKAERFGASLGYPVQDSTSIGMSYVVEKQKFTQSQKNYTFGLSHAVSADLTAGATLKGAEVNPKDNSEALVGLQYIYKNFITLMGDLGANYRQDLNTSSIYGAAIQFKIFQDVFLRTGYRENKFSRVRENGVGLGWVSPKLVVNLAYNTQRWAMLEDSKETAFSLSYRF